MLKTYRIMCKQTVYESVEVEASSEEEAFRKVVDEELFPGFYKGECFTEVCKNATRRNRWWREIMAEPQRQTAAAGK